MVTLPTNNKTFLSNQYITVCGYYFMEDSYIYIDTYSFVICCIVTCNHGITNECIEQDMWLEKFVFVEI